MGNLSGTVLKEVFRLFLIKRLINVFFLKISRFIGFDVELNVFIKVEDTLLGCNRQVFFCLNKLIPVMKRFVASLIKRLINK
jgi:hypothetical protein